MGRVRTVRQHPSGVHVPRGRVPGVATRSTPLSVRPASRSLTAVRSGAWVCRSLPAVSTATRSSTLQLATVRRPQLLPQAWPASRSRPRSRSLTRRPGTAPLGVVSAPSTTRRSGPLHPGLPHLARSVLEVRASSTGCSLTRVHVPEGTHAVRGVRSQDTFCAIGFRGCCHSRRWGRLSSARVAACAESSPRPGRLATFAARGAPRPPALRNQEVECPCATQ